MCECGVLTKLSEDALIVGERESTLYLLSAVIPVGGIIDRPRNPHHWHSIAINWFILLRTLSYGNILRILPVNVGITSD